MKEYLEVPYDTVFSIIETPHSEFDVYEAYDITNADNEGENKSVIRADNGVEITVKGDIAVRINNTRKSQPVRVLKTELDGETPLGGAVFTITIDGTNYTFTSDEDGYLKNETITDGMINVPFGSYTLTESTPPDGYIAIESGVVFSVDSAGIHAAPYQVKEPSEDEDYYTIIIPNNPGVVLPSTGGCGVRWIYLLGLCMIMVGTLSLVVRKRLKD